MPDGQKSLPELLSELWELITTYVRQETLDPVRGVGRFVAFGVAGALLIGTGGVVLAVGALRLLQTETGTALTGNLTWVPYTLVFVALLVGGGASLAAIGRGRDRGPAR